MRLKSILARSMPEGMRRVREQFGDSAVIVQTQESDAGVLITVAMDADPPARPSPARQVAAEGPVPASFPAALYQPGDSVETIADAMDRHAVPPHLADALTAAAEKVELDDPVEVLATVLRERFAFAPVQATSTRGAIMLVGPAGAGKTVTVARLAAEAVLAGRKVTLVTADAARAGAMAQLGTFARALGIELHQAEKGSAVPRTGRGNELVLIDGPAAGAFETEELRKVSDFAGLCAADPLLALPAGLDPSEAADIVGAYAALGARRLIGTRLDAVRRLGSLLAAADGLPIAFAGFTLSRSIGVPVDPAEPKSLALRLINQNTMKVSSPDGRQLQRVIR
jgi:flagellar biosynthesis protein FlhF